jgi:hypothetical protein
MRGISATTLIPLSTGLSLNQSAAPTNFLITTAIVASAVPVYGGIPHVATIVLHITKSITNVAKSVATIANA